MRANKPAFIAAIIFLELNGYTLKFMEENAEELVMGISSGTIGFEETYNWMMEHLTA